MCIDFLENTSKFSGLLHNFDNKTEVKNRIYLSLEKAILYSVSPHQRFTRSAENIAIVSESVA